MLVESGLKFSFDVKTTLMISDIAFYPSRTTHGYDLYASAADKEDILFLNLSNGKSDSRERPKSFVRMVTLVFCCFYRRLSIKDRNEQQPIKL